MIGRIVSYDGATLTIEADFEELWLLEKQNISAAEITLLDGRAISVKQRKTAYMLIRDIALHTGYTPEEAKEVLKYSFIEATGAQDFSLSDVSMTGARMFIMFLIEFCLVWDIPCHDSLLNHAEDIGRYLYICLLHRKCCLCGQPADIHHVDAVGMGSNRSKTSHIGKKAMALCRKHHSEAHKRGQKVFDALYHVFGICLDDHLVNRLDLSRMKEWKQIAILEGDYCEEETGTPRSNM